MIISLIKRRGWLIQKHLFQTLSIACLLPIMLHLTLTIPLKAIFVRSIWQIPIEQWIFPGLLFIITTLTILPHLYRDFFDLRIHKKSLMPMTLTPVSKYKLTLGILTVSVLESVIFTVVGGLIISLVSGIVFPWYDYLTMLLYLGMYAFLIGNIIITISLLTEHVSTFILLILVLISFVLFGSGVIIEYDYYPIALGYILRYSPIGIIVHGLRMLLFCRIVEWTSFVIPLIMIFFWIPLNAEILRRRLHQ